MTLRVEKLKEVAEIEAKIIAAKAELNEAELRVLEKAAEIFGKGSGRGETRKKLIAYHAKQANSHAQKAHAYHEKYKSMLKSDKQSPNEDMQGILAQHHAKLANSHDFVHQSMTGKTSFNPMKGDDSTHGFHVRNYMDHIQKKNNWE